MPKRTDLIPIESIEGRILLLRGQKVMLSTHLASLYGVETRALLQAVKRNLDRFPEDFMFQLSRGEWVSLRSQFVISNGRPGSGGERYRPYAFTEQGVAMLSSVLNSPRAIRVNIEIMRAFVRLHRMLATHADLARKIADMEKRYDAQFKVVFDAIRELMDKTERGAIPPAEGEEPGKKIGFHVRERRAAYGRRPGRPRGPVGPSPSGLILTHISGSN